MKIYYCNINEFKDFQGTEYLSSERQERFNRYRTEQSKAACLVSGLLLRMTLGADYEKHLTTNPHGKPMLKDRSCFFNIYFCLLNSFFISFNCINHSFFI